MKVLSMRYCTVTPESTALQHFFRSLGLAPLQTKTAEGQDVSDNIFLAGNSWVEIWPVGDDMPAGTMLQIVVDDADAFAEQARQQGLDPQGPMDAHGERIYFLEAPTGLPVSFQSRLNSLD
ncbi:VOC family protein [Saccharospirillum mangrovi]|uniref:VOC family protein n=1 Tax=Saccharospirillum mangrovi TaxID=2161747 RepID=UPI000D3483D7|nr:hypothetical protein [Saccharospirillum mangrovi]